MSVRGYVEGCAVEEYLQLNLNIVLYCNASKLVVSGERSDWSIGLNLFSTIHVNKSVCLWFKK